MRIPEMKYIRVRTAGLRRVYKSCIISFFPPTTIRHGLTQITFGSPAPHAGTQTHPFLSTACRRGQSFRTCGRLLVFVF